MSERGWVPVNLYYIQNEIKEHDCAFEDFETGGILRLYKEGWVLRAYSHYDCNTMLAELETSGTLPKIIVKETMMSGVTVRVTMKTRDIEGVFSGKSSTTIRTHESLGRFQALVREIQVRRRWNGEDIDFDEPD